jgi:hypothetical protein
MHRAPSIAAAASALLTVALALVSMSSARVPLWSAAVPAALFVALVGLDVAVRLRRPTLRAGPAFYRAGGGPTRATLRVVNRGARGVLRAQVIGVQMFLRDGTEINTPTAPWPVPWHPEDEGWANGPGASGERHLLLHGEMATLSVGWLELWTGKPNTFSFFGVDHHQPYPLVMPSGRPAVSLVRLALALRNDDTGRSWTWDVEVNFPPESYELDISVQKRR